MSEQVYYQRSLAADVYPHLKMALELIDVSMPKVAVDVGCGAGRDALFLAESGFRYMRLTKVMRLFLAWKKSVPGTSIKRYLLRSAALIDLSIQNRLW
ncbi:hypothetical protein [Nitrincola nitratireducens]|uniref:Tellurite resistance protein TehB n=1 Tax=Nitrincola nitratireducens TaxID=1229521 RepID=W9VLM5_9GAMM|nr:hypothetical protein [Nitrincola nitratireducens]EXJ11430.1 hypothetical protein D791_01562 [Nitrincola nitratireducens]